MELSLLLFVIYYVTNNLLSNNVNVSYLKRTIYVTFVLF